jgi:perosamine synthetase
MIEETRLSPEEFASIADRIPGPEPELTPAPDRIRKPGDSGILRVCETQLDGNERRYLVECIESNWISSGGPFLPRFERLFSEAMGCRFGIACANGTAALHLALATLGIGAGDEVVIPAFTMIATANAVAYTGAAPVLVDAEPRTWNMDPGQIESRIGPRTRAIVVVHTYGHPVEFDAIAKTAERHGIPIVEDAAEAHGALYRGRPVGGLGAAATFSFYGNKIVSTGEGGMVTTNDPEIARLARLLRDHAFSSDRHFWHTLPGFNYRMTNLQAAVGLAQTERLARLVDARRDHARLYSQRLTAVRGLTLPFEAEGVRSVNWMYGILVGDDFGISRDELRRRLAARGIETRTFFIPIHFQPIYFRKYSGLKFPVAEDLCRRGMYLPSGSGLSEEEIDFVAREIAAAAKRG